MTHELRFPGTPFPPIRVGAGAPLPTVLDSTNSPVLFGCQTGICGTCVCAVTPAGPIPGPSDDEREVLGIVAPDEPTARLACQLDVRADLAIRALDW